MSTADLDQGFVYGYALDGTGGARPISLADVHGRSAVQGVLWLHLDYTDAVSRQWLLNDSGLPRLVVDALMTDETRPRATAVGDGLLLALRGVNLNPGAEPDDMVAVRLWIDRSRVISTRRRKLLSIEDIVGLLQDGNGPTTAADFLVTFIDRLVWRMSDTVDDLEDRVGDLEERTLESGSGNLRLDLATVRRQTIMLRRYLAPQRDALARLITEKVDWLGDDDRLRLREVGDRLIRHVEDLDAVRERAAVSQEELVSRLSEQLNRRMYVLSVVAAVFLPLGFLTGLLGVNLGGLPGADNPRGFLEFAAVLVVVLALQVLIFRWKRWL